MKKKDRYQRCRHQEEEFARDCGYYGKGARCSLTTCPRYESNDTTEDNQPES